MKIVTFNPESKTVGQPMGKYFFEIFFEYNGEFYPKEHWTDFGCIVLGWWVTTIIKIFRGELDECNFSFMDGPYSLSVRLDKDAQILFLQPGNTNKIWTVDFIEFVEQLILAVRSISDFFESSLEYSDKLILSKYLDILIDVRNDLADPDPKK
jgi:hypothetical protein